MRKAKTNMASKGKQQNRLILILSAVLLVAATPFLINFITNYTQTMFNYASPASVSTISLNPSTSAPALGNLVSFSTTYPKEINDLRIELLCYQDGKLTFGMAGGVDYQFLLGGTKSLWLDQGGDADCVANLFYFSEENGMQKYNFLSTTSFKAADKQ